MEENRNESDKHMNEPIAIFLPNLEGGGAERIMVTIANEAARRGHIVDLVLAEAVGPYLSSVEPRVNIIDLGAKKIGSALLPLCRYILTRRPSAIISALNRANLVAIAAVIITGRKVPLVVSERNHLSTASISETGKFRKILPILIRFFYPFSSRVIAISQGVADDLIETTKLDRDHVVVVHNPIEFEKIKQLSHEAFNPDEFLVEGKLIIAVGRLHPQKDFSTLIEAFALVRKSISSTLLILGEGPEKSLLEAHARRLGISEYVHLIGRKENPFPYMRAAELFVLSSLHEGFGNVIVEALACGCKVVSTDCPSGPAEILENGKWGYLVPVRDPESLAAAMIQTLTEGPRPGSIERARQFSVVTATDSYLRLAHLETSYEKL